MPVRVKTGRKEVVSVLDERASGGGVNVLDPEGFRVLYSAATQCATEVMANYENYVLPR